ncbi:MAG TPA: hydantoinase/oxoprolinase family protein [Candidatus Lambdaproteobacteria bacterium]|nr:hydantoinase/oxoprolinase family protein [Candidatus Lambdaproteobacteria bacterium]
MNNNISSYVVGVDVGGTFTDFFFLDETTGDCKVAKVQTTLNNQAEGFLAGILKNVDQVADITTVVHGTTVGTNALHERKGAKTGIITSEGFRDVLEMRRRDRPQTWGLWGSFQPVVPRNLRLEVAERTLADGTVQTTVNREEVKQAAHKLLAAGVESVSIVFINSYANPENEQIALKIVKEIWPNEFVEISANILPEIREFERTSTTTLNAYLQPTIGSYLAKIEAGLKDEGFKGQLLIVQSNGGVMTVDTARNLPIRTALSGPAAGVIASAYIACEADFPHVITCDMGGTSFDVSLVENCKNTLSAQTNIGFGMTIRTPMIEITTIGAGGGSIAKVDSTNLLQVGPESAGSFPGPVCYGLGNDCPTVTDANVVLGRINANKPIGGKLSRLDVKSAKASIEKQIAAPLGLDVMTAAEAIIKVANSKMAGAIRLVSIERGYDPQKFAAMPFGGGGALHVGALIREVGLRSAIIPRYPGINSALGCVIADMRHDFVQTVNGVLGVLDLKKLEQAMLSLARKGLDLLKNAGVSFKSTKVLFAMDMCYQGQTHTLDVSIPVNFNEYSIAINVKMILDAFEESYRTIYGQPLEGIPVRILNLRTSVLGLRPKFDLTLLAPADGVTLEDMRTDTRQVWFDGAWLETAIYDRLPLSIGVTVPGPAILEQPDSTIFIEPGLRGKVDCFGNLLITNSN